jgi:hypothetical protein
MQTRNATHAQTDVVRFLIWRLVLVAVSTILILGLYPAVLRAIAPVGP